MNSLKAVDPTLGSYTAVRHDSEKREIAVPYKNRGYGLPWMMMMTAAETVKYTIIFSEWVEMLMVCFPRDSVNEAL